MYVDGTYSTNLPQWVNLWGSAIRLVVVRKMTSSCECPVTTTRSVKYCRQAVVWDCMSLSSTVHRKDPSDIGTVPARGLIHSMFWRRLQWLFCWLSTYRFPSDCSSVVQSIESFRLQPLTNYRVVSFSSLVKLMGLPYTLHIWKECFERSLIWFVLTTTQEKSLEVSATFRWSRSSAFKAINS